MANPSVNGGTPFSGKLRVEGIQSVVPTKPTDPRQSSRIIVASQNPKSSAAAAAMMRRRFHVLLCYNKASSDESGWVVAGQMRESLARALQEQPLLAGRLRRREDEELEIVSNDSGGRLVEAAAEMELGDFVRMMKKEEKKREGEAELVFWEDVLHHTQFSPLFYVQVTNFTCGGYSIGISCSLLLSDPFALTNTIKKWANDHNTIVSKSEIPKTPTFYLPNHGKPASSPSLLMGPNTNKDSAQSIIFNVPTNTPNLDKGIFKNLAALCVEEAEIEASRELASSLSLLVKAPLEDVRVEECSRTGLLECSRTGLLECSKSDYNTNGMSCERTWDELELKKICFSEGNKPIYASSWVNSVVDEGCVMIVPSTHSGVKIVVTFS